MCPYWARHRATGAAPIGPRRHRGSPRLAGTTSNPCSAPSSTHGESRSHAAALAAVTNSPSRREHHHIATRVAPGRLHRDHPASPVTCTRLATPHSGGHLGRVPSDGRPTLNVRHIRTCRRAFTAYLLCSTSQLPGAQTSPWQCRSGWTGSRNSMFPPAAGGGRVNTCTIITTGGGALQTARAPSLARRPGPAR